MPPQLSFRAQAMNIEPAEQQPGQGPPRVRPARSVSPISAEALAGIRNHPMLPDATVALFEALTRHQAAQGLRRFIVGDKGRRLGFWTALSLHAERDFGDGSGLTVNRFCDRLHQNGDMSRGRARALFLFMRHVGFIDRAGEARPGLPVPYAPAGRMIRLATERLTVALRALDKISPVGREGIVALSDPDFVTLLVVKIGGLFADGVRPLASQPQFSTFFGPDGGEYIAMHIALAHFAATPEARIEGFAFQLTAAAKATHLSRPHVSKMIAQAVDAGLLVRRGREEITVTGRFLDTIADATALTLAHLEHLTSAALREYSERS